MSVRTVGKWRKGHPRLISYPAPYPMFRIVMWMASRVALAASVMIPTRKMPVTASFLLVDILKFHI